MLQVMGVDDEVLTVSFLREESNHFHYFFTVQGLLHSIQKTSGGFRTKTYYLETFIWILVPH